MKAVRSVVLLMPASLPAATLPLLHGQTPYVEVNDGIGTLQGWYNSNWGYSSAFSSTFTNAQNTHANFENNYYDDAAWWALAWIDAYDLTGDSSYLSMAETMSSYETSGWTTTECGGGMILAFPLVSPYNIYGILESGSNTYGTWVSRAIGAAAATSSTRASHNGEPMLLLQCRRPGG